MTVRLGFINSLQVSFRLATILAVLIATPLGAQFADGIGEFSVEGVVSWQGGGPLAPFRVELNEAGGRTVWANVDLDGTFEIRTSGRPRGQCTLRVHDPQGNVIHEEFVRPGSGVLRIDVVTESKDRPITGVVSVEALRNRPPKRALREFHRAQEAVRKGEVQRAISHLQKALEIHPRFFEAHNSLGVRYLLLGDYPTATVSLEEALRLRPDSHEALSNLALALHGLGKREEAERASRRAVEVDPQSARSRFVLGLILASGGAREQEALQLLGEVAGQIPAAHLHAAVVLGDHGDYQGVARELRSYLKSGEKRYRQEAEQWMHRVELQLSGN